MVSTKIFYCNNFCIQAILIIPCTGIHYNRSRFAATFKLEECLPIATARVIDLQVMVICICPIQLLAHPIPRYPI